MTMQATIVYMCMRLHEPERVFLSNTIGLLTFLRIKIFQAHLLYFCVHVGRKRISKIATETVADLYESNGK